MRILFMGTPEFAVPSLNILLDNGYEVLAVVTAPDKPGGRLGVQQSAVKQYAVAKGIKVLQPEKLKNPAFLEALRALQPDLQIVVAFRMLPEAVWALPPLGTMNLHGSLLPKYRGAAPINWAVINGETETGLTTFLLKHEIDTGDLLFQEKVPIGPDETAGELHDRMMKVGAELVLKSVQAIEKGAIEPLPQKDTEATHAPKLFAETCKINFQQPKAAMHNFVRGLSPYPGAWTPLQGKTLKIYRTSLSFPTNASDELLWALPPDTETWVRLPAAHTRSQPVVAGTFLSDGKNSLEFMALDGCLSITELQLEGKKRMATRDFLNGYKFS